MQLALVLILSNIENKYLESIKNSMCSSYTDVNLHECALNLPDTNDKVNYKILRDLEACKIS